MRASTPEPVSGPVEIAFALDLPDGHAAVDPVEAASTWVDAVRLGFFGPADVRVREAFQAVGGRVVGAIDCERVPAVAFEVLSRLVLRTPLGGAPVPRDPPPGWPEPPAAPPFEVEYPADLRRLVRVEFEFAEALDVDQRETLFGAFSVWDEIVEAMAGPEWVGQESDCRSRRVGPRTVEHEVDGFHAEFDCLYAMVWFGLRLHARWPVRRLTIE